MTDIIIDIPGQIPIKMTDCSKAVGHDQSVFFRSFIFSQGTDKRCNHILDDADLIFVAIIQEFFNVFFKFWFAAGAGG